MPSGDPYRELRILERIIRDQLPVGLHVVDVKILHTETSPFTNDVKCEFQFTSRQEIFVPKHRLEAALEAAGVEPYVSRKLPRFDRSSAESFRAPCEVPGPNGFTMIKEPSLSPEQDDEIDIFGKLSPSKESKE